MDKEPVELGFTARVIYWRGPSPFFFVAVPDEQAETVRNAARAVTYGWGMVPVTATIGAISFTTALFPKDGTYLLPLKVKLRRDAGIDAGDIVSVEMVIG